MKINIEVGVKTSWKWYKMVNGAKLLFFSKILGDWNRRISFGQGKCPAASQPAGWLASQQKVPPSPGLIIISIIIIVIILKLLVISSISTISFIHLCNMNDINNNIVRTDHNGGAIMVSA